MKKTILLPVIILIIFMFAGCGKKSPAANGPAPQRIIKLNGFTPADVNSGYLQFDYDSSNRLLNLKSYTLPGPSLVVRYTYEYHPDGRINTMTSYNSSETLSGVHVFLYGADGKLNTKNSYTPGMTLDMYYEYSYYADSRLATRTAYSALTPGVPGSYIVFEYDQAGRLVKYTTLDAAFVMLRYTAFEYGSNGKMSKLTNYDAASTVTDHNDFEYDADASLVKDWYYSPEPALFNYRVPEYEAGTGNYDYLNFLSFVYL